MRLLTTRGAPTLIECDEDATRPKYAILSHTWFDANEEVNYAELASCHRDKRKLGWSKVSGARQEALRRGFEYIWIDACCIDKTSSAELSEAVNSMYQWYRDAELCLVYLIDVTSAESLENCRWFTRGWTLQEMLAPLPRHLYFFNQEWQSLGSLEERAEEIAEITSVHIDLLRDPQGRDVALESYSAAQKMSWAASRSTTRIEDQAYCLLGLFNVNLPIIYGEGPKAFIRLQEQILRTNPDDHTILMWRREEQTINHHSLLAPNSSYFGSCGDIARATVFPGTDEEGQQIEVLSYGIRLWAPVIQAPKNFDGELHAPCIALLKCQNASGSSISAYALELSPAAGNQHFAALREHRFDAYTAAKYKHRAKPLSIYFLSHKSSPRITGPEGTQTCQSRSLHVERVLVRWAGKEGRWIHTAYPADAWEEQSQSFKIQLNSDTSVFKGIIQADQSRVPWTLIELRPVFVCFTVRIREEGHHFIVDTAVKITFGTSSRFDLPDEDLLDGPWCTSTIVLPTAMLTNERRGDKIGRFTLAHTIARQSDSQLLEASILPVSIAGKNHLVVELATGSSVTAHYTWLLLRSLHRLPGWILDVSKVVRSTTPNEILELADDADKVLKMNYQYADLNALILAKDVGWYSKVGRNPRLWSDLREKRHGRSEKETWNGFELGFRAFGLFRGRYTDQFWYISDLWTYYEVILLLLLFRESLLLTAITFVGMLQTGY